MTTLVAIRKPTRLEKKRGAEIVFEREDRLGYKYVILACRCYESWEQWGAVDTSVLGDNVSTVEAWRNGDLVDINWYDCSDQADSLDISEPEGIDGAALLALSQEQASARNAGHCAMNRMNYERYLALLRR